MMYMRVFSLVTVAVLGARAEEVLDAGECLLSYRGELLGATDLCIPMAAFAKCLSKVAPGDKNAATASAELQEAQVRTQGCNLKVTPSMTIVDRELRVVTNEDVKFERFRRDEVGVFELKEMIETNIGSIADVKVGVQTVTDALAEQIAASKVATDEAKAAQVTFKAEVEEGSLKSMQTTVAGIEGTVNMLKRSGSGCVPNVEYETKAATATEPAECKYLAYECEMGMFESERPTRTTDRVCKKWTTRSCKEAEYVVDGTSRTDSKCVAATACNTNQYVVKELEHNSDRVCAALPSKCTVVSRGLTTLFVGEKQVKTACDGEKSLGGDGSSKALAGKSCYTIKFVHEKSVSGKFWVYEKEPNSPFEIYCEMMQCGWDKGGDWTDRAQCGGWSLVMKTTSGNTCLNRRQTSQWKGTTALGDTKSLKNECAKGVTYSRSSYSDVMIASNRKDKQNLNTAWRMPASYSSLYDNVKGCKRTQHGRLMIPGYGAPSTAQKRDALMHLDWRSCQGDGHCRDNGRDYHAMCTNADQTFGTFQKDSNCCGGNIAGCRSPGGHAGNIVGVGGDCGGDCPRTYGYGDDKFTRCISAWGYGGSYGNGNSETATGHWWGHGQSHMQIFESAMYVRDSADIKNLL